jgi:hypothetical protein
VVGLERMRGSGKFKCSDHGRPRSGVEGRLPAQRNPAAAITTNTRMLRRRLRRPAGWVVIVVVVVVVDCVCVCV